MPNLLSRLKHALSKEEWGRAFSKLMSASVISQLLWLLATPLLARIYDPTTFGIYGFYAAICGIFAAVATGRFEQAIPIPKNSLDAYALLYLCSAFSILSAFLSWIIVSLPWFIDYFEQIDSIPSGAIPAGVGILGLIQAFTALNTRFFRFSSMSLSLVGRSIFFIVLAYLLSLRQENNSGLILSQIASLIIGLLILFAPNMKSLPRREMPWSVIKRNFIQFSDFLKYNTLHSLVNNFSGQLPLLLVASIFGSSEAGLFSLAWRISLAPVTVIVSSLTPLVIENLSRKLREDKSMYFDTTKIIFRSVIFWPPLSLAMGVICFYSISTIFGSEWGESGWYVLCLVPVIASIGIVGPLAFVPQILGKQRQCFYFEVAGLAIKGGALLMTTFLFQSPKLAILSFSCVSVLIHASYIFWVRTLVKKAHPLR